MEVAVVDPRPVIRSRTGLGSSFCLHDLTVLRTIELERLKRSNPGDTSPWDELMTESTEGSGEGNLDRAPALLARYISDKGLKSTRQRDIIAETFLHQRGHLNVDELLERVRMQDDRISAATVYRTMKLLTECGLAAPRRFDDGQELLQAASAPRD